MKMRLKLLLIGMIVTLSGCQETEFKVGECIQKPDSMKIFKINKIEEEMAIVKVVAPKMGLDQKSTEREIKLSSDWIVTSCP